MSECVIVRSKAGAYYEMFVDGQHVGNYDTATEAAKEYDKIKEEANDIQQNVE